MFSLTRRDGYFKCINVKWHLNFFMVCCPKKGPYPKKVGVSNIYIAILSSNFKCCPSMDASYINPLGLGLIPVLCYLPDLNNSICRINIIYFL